MKRIINELLQYKNIDVTNNRLLIPAKYRFKPMLMAYENNKDIRYIYSIHQSDYVYNSFYFTDHEK